MTESLIKTVNQEISYRARTESQIPLMAEKLTDIVGEVFPFADKEEKIAYFDLMLADLLLLASNDGCIAAGCALETIKALLSKFDLDNVQLSLDYQGE